MSENGRSVQPHANGEPKRYSAAMKEKAVLLYVDVGATAAGEQLGINPATIETWARRAGVKAPAGRKADLERQRWEERRLEMAHEIGDTAQEALAQVREYLTGKDPTKAQKSATTMAILIDKAQLLTGGATARTYGVPNPDEQKKRAKELDELAEKRARRVS